MIRGSLLQASLLPGLCLPTIVAVLFALAALIALASFLWEVRQAQLTRRKERARRPWPPAERRQERRIGIALPPAAWLKLAAALVGLALAAVSFPPCPPDVRISLSDSRLNPQGNERASEEYVCLVNHEDGAVSLAGWELRNAERTINVLPDFSLAGGAAVRVHPGPGRNSATDLYGEKSRHWANERGDVYLYDDEGNEIDHVPYGIRGQNDGSGECDSGAAPSGGTGGGSAGGGETLALAITSPADRVVVDSEAVTIRGTVTPGSVVYAKIDHDDESDSGGTEAKISSGGSLDRFSVRLQLDKGRNSIRVQAEKPGSDPVTEFVGVVRKVSTPCDPNYRGACLDPDAVDYDCRGGEGDGPEYVEGPIEVVGEDHFDLDRDGDHVACGP